MGEVLWTPSWDIPPNFNLFRPYFLGHVIGWWAGTTVDETDNPIRLTEHLFGGYQTYLKLYDFWWNFNTGEFHVEDIIEDFYAIQPITGLHVSMGVVTVGLSFSPDIGYYWLNFQFATPPAYLYFPLPTSPGGHWFDG